MTAEGDAAVAAVCIDRIAELVEERYPKGTTDSLGKALRHQLHKLGRLNEPPAPVSKYGFAVLVQLGGLNKDASRFDVYVFQDWPEAYRLALQERRYGGNVVIRSLQQVTGGLWGGRISDPRSGETAN